MLWVECSGIKRLRRVCLHSQLLPLVRLTAEFSEASQKRQRRISPTLLASWPPLCPVSPTSIIVFICFCFSLPLVPERANSFQLNLCPWHSSGEVFKPIRVLRLPLFSFVSTQASWQMRCWLLNMDVISRGGRKPSQAFCSTAALIVQTCSIASFEHFKCCDIHERCVDRATSDPLSERQGYGEVTWNRASNEESYFTSGCHVMNWKRRILTVLYRSFGVL